MPARVRLAPGSAGRASRIAERPPLQDPRAHSLRADANVLGAAPGAASVTHSSNELDSSVSPGTTLAVRNPR